MASDNLNHTTNHTMSEPERNLTIRVALANMHGEQLIGGQQVLNVTREYPLDYGVVMLGYLMPFVVFLTVSTNALVVMVLAQKHMHTPTNIVLFTMAIVDLLTLLPPAPCIWLALLLAGQRYIYLCHPTLARTWCTVPRVKKAIIIIIVIAVLHQFTRFFDNNFIPAKVLASDEPNACEIKTADWVHDLNTAMYFITYYAFRILFVYIVPCVSLITLNCLLFRALRRAEDRRSKLLKTKFKLIGANQCSNSGSNNFNVERANTRVDQSIKNRVPQSLLMFLKSKPKEDKRACLGQESLDKTELNRWGIIRNTPENTLPKGDPTRSSNDITGEHKIQCSTFEDQKTDIKRANHKRGQGKSKSTKNFKTINRLDNCSIASNDSPSQRKQVNSKSLSEVDRSENNEEASIGYIDSENDCPECIACDENQQLNCHHCSIGTGAETNAGEHSHGAQIVSLCSSLIGEATNTTTNEDTSSCLVTQNASSSMYVVHDETLDALGTESMAGGDVEELDNIDQEHLLLSTNESRSKDRASTKAGKLRLTKSESVDLACGCLSSATEPMSVRLNSGGCRASAKLITAGFTGRRRFKGRLKKSVVSCRNSEPCLDCCNRSGIQCVRSCLLMSPDKVLVSESQSNHYNIDDGQDNVDISMNEAIITAPNTTATTTTATITFNSIKNNTTGSSLQQIQNQRLSTKNLLARPKNAALGSGAIGVNETKPPASSTGNLVTTTTTTKTIDSNRTTLMLIVVVSVFLMVEVPVAAVTVIHVILNSFDVFKDVAEDEMFSYIKLFTNFLIMISYSVNFTIYCSMSKKFRETFRDLFSKNGRKRAKKNQFSQQKLHTPATTATNNFGATLQNDFNTTVTGFNPTAPGISRYSSLRIPTSQQQECEL